MLGYFPLHTHVLPAALRWKAATSRSTPNLDCEDLSSLWISPKSVANQIVGCNSCANQSCSKLRATVVWKSQSGLVSAWILPVAYPCTAGCSDFACRALLQSSKLGVRGFILALDLPKVGGEPNCRVQILCEPKLFEAASDSCVEASVRFGICMDTSRCIPMHCRLL